MYCISTKCKIIHFLQKAQYKQFFSFGTNPQTSQLSNTGRKISFSVKKISNLSHNHNKTTYSTLSQHYLVFCNFCWNVKIAFVMAPGLSVVMECPQRGIKSTWTQFGKASFNISTPDTSITWNTYKLIVNWIHCKESGSVSYIHLGKKDVRRVGEQFSN